MNDEIALLRNHIERLERRLEDYHEHLSDVVKERDELALDAAWGVTQSVVLLVKTIGNAVLGAVIGFFAAQYASTVVAICVGVAVFLVAQALGQRRSWSKVNKLRLDEKATLQALPEWKSEAEKLW